MILYENVKKKLQKLKITLHVNFTVEIFLDDNFSSTNTLPNQLYCADHRGLFSWAPM